MTVNFNIPSDFVTFIKAEMEAKNECKVNIGMICSFFNCGYNKAYILRQYLALNYPFFVDVHGFLVVDQKKFDKYLIDVEIANENERSEYASLLQRQRELVESKKPKETEEVRIKREADEKYWVYMRRKEDEDDSFNPHEVY